MTGREHRACWLMVVVITGCFCSRIRSPCPEAGNVQVSTEPRVVGVMATGCLSLERTKTQGSDSHGQSACWPARQWTETTSTAVGPPSCPRTRPFRPQCLHWWLRMTLGREGPTLAASGQVQTCPSC